MLELVDQVKGVAPMDSWRDSKSRRIEVSMDLLGVILWGQDLGGSSLGVIRMLMDAAVTLGVVLPVVLAGLYERWRDVV